MSDDLQRLKEDVDFMKALATDDGNVLKASGVGLIVASIAFGLMTLRGALIEQGWLVWPEALVPFMPFDGAVLFFVVLFTCFYLMSRRAGMVRPPSPNAASRAMWASWAAAGLGFGISQAGMSYAGDSTLAVVPLFAFWGSGWFVVWAIYRRAWQLVVTVACFATVILMGLVYDTPYRGFVLSLGFFALVGAPGVLVYRQAKAIG